MSNCVFVEECHVFNIYTNSALHVYIIRENFVPSSSDHNHETRFIAKVVKREVKVQSPFWNNIPQNIRDSNSYKTFKSSAKKHVIYLTDY